MTRPRAKKRLPRWPKWHFMVAKSDFVTAVTARRYDDRAKRLVVFVQRDCTRWLAAYDARQKRGKP